VANVIVAEAEFIAHLEARGERCVVLGSAVPVSPGDLYNVVTGRFTPGPRPEPVPTLEERIAALEKAVKPTP